LSKARSADVTALLREWRTGDEQAANRLLPLVRDKLQRIARRHMASERGRAAILRRSQRCRTCRDLDDLAGDRHTRLEFAKNWRLRELSRAQSAGA
jgi:ECF sigma factor